MPTQDEESHPPSAPGGVEGTLTVGTRQIPTACAHVPAMMLPAHLLDVDAASEVFVAAASKCVTPA